MAQSLGAQRMVLQAIQDAQGDTPSFIEDTRIAQATRSRSGTCGTGSSLSTRMNTSIWP